MATQYWNVDPAAELTRELSAEGLGALPRNTVMAQFKDTVSKFGSENALNQERNGTWVRWTWQEYYNETIKFAKALISEAVGFQPHQSVNIIGFNSPEWFFADVGAIAAGGWAAGIYTTNGPEACQYVSDHSEAVVVVVQDRVQLAKFLQIAPNLPHLKALVVYQDNVEDSDRQALEGTQVTAYTYAEFVELGNDVSDEAVEERINNQRPGHGSTLIYTSGTTGNPKAVMISHDSITWTGQLVLNAVGGLGNTDRIVSYLPLSHIAAQMLDIHAPMAIGASVFFARPDALKGSIGTTLKFVRPTVFFGVPRVWEKIEEKMRAVGRSTTGFKKSISTWAKAKGLEKNVNAQFGNSQSIPCGFGCANTLVFSKIKGVLGLDQCRVCCTGAAPIAPETLHYFAQLDIQILELYGMSECCGPQTMNTHDAWKMGTCGRSLPGTELMLAEGTGEVCYRGRHIMMGYMKNAEKTAETIDDDGWLHSGDIGTVDSDGFLSITGRIKELIITAGGENIPPVLIENEFKAAMPCISQCVVIGDKRKFLSILITLKQKVDMESGAPTGELDGDALLVSEQIGSEARTIQAAMECEKWAEYLEAGKGRANKKATSKAQNVAKYALLEDDFHVGNNCLTPTQKLKRPIINDVFSAQIEAIYSEGAGEGGAESKV
jgi:long-chain-fatty-acid--CoA ligase ACSBG